MRRFGVLRQVGVEGTGAYGAGLTRFLTAQGVEVVEINRPDRQRRRRRGKSDTTDAEIRPIRSRPSNGPCVFFVAATASSVNRSQSSIATCPRTKAYVERRTAEGRSNKEIIRCLQRYVAREIHALLVKDHVVITGAELRAERARKNRSLAQAAEALDTGPIKLSRLERGLDHDSENGRSLPRMA